MSDSVTAVCLTAMWIIALMRLPGARKSAKHLFISIALLSGCVVVSVQQPLISTWVAASAHPSLPFVSTMVFTISAMTGILCWCVAPERGYNPWAGEIRRLWIRAGLIAAVLSTTAVAFHLEEKSAYAAVGAGHGTPPQWLCLAGYEIYMVYALATQMVRFRGLAHTATSRLVKTSLYMLVASTVGSSTRSIYTMLYLVPQVVGLPEPGVPWSASFSYTVNMPFHALGFVALTVPALSVPLEYLQTRRYLRAITPLWEELRSAYPEVVRVSERLPQQHMRLLAQVTELFDALTLMFASPGVAAALNRARLTARAAEIPEGKVEAVAHAASIAYALQHGPRAGEMRPTSWSYQDPREDDLRSAIAWLADVATEFRSNPFVSHFATTVPAPTPAE
ncbi:hypothetical protein Misp03_35540 [Microbispora sp. NBRC 16548]|nr:hypothetical protein Misp03_35540 [Microbispora sp. NBRC 16548]